VFNKGGMVITVGLWLEAEYKGVEPKSQTVTDLGSKRGSQSEGRGVGAVGIYTGVREI
jgi:hypothetical protein